MRIQKLVIKDYYNLKDFVFEPDAGPPTTVVLGRNGSGKSNLIEALVDIFRDLEAGVVSAFDYELTYRCRDHSIEIINQPEQKTKQRITVDGAKLRGKKAFQKNADVYLPKHVFAYYSGWNKRLEARFDQPTNKLYNEWKSGSASENIPLRRMFYCRKDYSQMVLLAFFLLDDDPKVRKFLNEYLNIADFESALFVMHKPYWRKGKNVSYSDQDDVDPKFWYARGRFLNFLDRLWRHALAPIRAEQTKKIDFRDRTEDSEHVYLYIKNKDVLKELRYPGEDETHFFAQLEGLYLCDLIDEVRVTVKHNQAGQIRFDQLSEGEQQLLTVLGLLHFTKDEESLFLLDEPDTHLNPSWTYDYLALISDQVEEDNSQLLIATHNPLMIGSLHKEQVRLLRKVDTETGFKIVADAPEDDPIGMGVDGLLQSEIYGMRTILAPEVMEKIDRRQQLLAMHQKTRGILEEIQGLSDELAELGIALSHPNPYFDRFAKAMASNPLFQKPVVSPEEMKQISALSEQLAEEISREESIAALEDGVFKWRSVAMEDLGNPQLLPHIKKLKGEEGES